MENLNRIRWSCRRGMLELDMLLISFFDDKYQVLKKEEQKEFVKMLECTDAELFNWLVKKIPCDKGHSKLIENILLNYKQHV